MLRGGKVTGGSVEEWRLLSRTPPDLWFSNNDKNTSFSSEKASPPLPGRTSDTKFATFAAKSTFFDRDFLPAVVLLHVCTDIGGNFKLSHSWAAGSPTVTLSCSTSGGVPPGLEGGVEGGAINQSFISSGAEMVRV